ncbi:MAG TPA: DUF1015 family protein [Kiritimatiellia bacterium]|jgi:uncharacterized protein (DUF1015 family)|nr:DUF1015 family protein [Kiritimatiellia bacterium]HOR97148.1 DUF1015 family protein [Kiritimatiellia bacterium]HPW74689.1 DUF1015 family protein [Kiritimatiellia bacterium]HRU19059.1 DUF1015 family protein [Kiritimatiellia bacterium]
MLIKPFAALRPAPDRAASLASVPYDVVDTAEARALAAGNPDSFLHVSRPEIDLPDTVDIYDDAVYAQGARAFAELQARGVLLREAEERIYVYRQIMGTHSQTGVVACCHIDDYARDVIRKHEKTRQDKEDDRTRHCLELNANSGPVFLTYRTREDLDARVAQAQQATPLYDFTAADGVRHTVWRAEDDPAAWVEAFHHVPLAYVADGHHRAAAAFRAGKQRREAHPGHTGHEEYNWFLAVLFPADQLRILPYNRCVADLNGLTPDAFLERVRTLFRTEPTDGAEPAGPREIRMFLNGAWHRLTWEAVDADPVGRLDVSVLQNRLLGPVLGIDDPRTNTRIAFVGGIRGTGELVQRVTSGQDAVAFSMFPVTVQQMMDIADAGQIMPPKSTWFEPKLRSGLLVHTLD